jgi:Fe-S-cluster containining protein
MSGHKFPDTIARINPGDHFSFSCHPDIACFTDCCRSLELALSPYDILRLRYATGLTSAQLLDRFIITEQDKSDIFPRFYLSMVDDGQASCAFVTSKGCAVYEHRPGACRTYPLGRAVTRRDDRVEDFFVLLQEDHCRGFQEKRIQTTSSYTISQELESYNIFNDMLTEIQQHEKIRAGMQLSCEQRAEYTLALYNLDTFRQQLTKGNLPDIALNLAEETDDESLLRYAFKWLKYRLFS